MIKVQKIKESEWGKTYGSCQCCNKYDVTSIVVRSMEMRLCDKHLKELLDKLKEKYMEKPPLGLRPCFCEVAYVGKWLDNRDGYFCPICGGFMSKKRFHLKIFPGDNDVGFKEAPLYLPNYRAFVRRGIANLYEGFIHSKRDII